MKLCSVWRVLVVGGLVWGGCVPAAWGRFQPVTCSNSFTPEQEQAEGAKVAAEIYKQMPVLPDSDPVSRYVRDLGMRLVQQAPWLRWQYNFHVVASEDINAFALPGGSIFVNLGTVRAAETEAQLAGVSSNWPATYCRMPSPNRNSPRRSCETTPSTARAMCCSRQ